MSLVTQAILQAEGAAGHPCNDCHAGAGNASQAGATRLKGSLIRFTTATGSANSGILPPVASDSTASKVVVINDTTVSINIYPSVGEAMNNSANANTAIAAGKAGVFYRTAAGLLPGTALGWAGGVIG